MSKKDSVDKSDKELTDASKGKGSDKATKVLADWAKEIQKDSDKK